MQQLASGLWVDGDVRNGTVPHPAPNPADLEVDLTVGYWPQIPVEGLYNGQGIPVLWLRSDVERMRTHPTVSQAMRYFRGGIAGAEFWGGPVPDQPDDEMGLPISQDVRVGDFVKKMCDRWFDRGVPQLQGFGYEYGYCGAESICDQEDGLMTWSRLSTFSPFDTFLLTERYEPVGIRVRNVRGKAEAVDLWMAGDDIPAKGVWYSHQPRYHPYYGESQLTGAWRPWRRLAWKDGAETVLDGAMYRFGYQGPIGRYPNRDMVGPQPGVANTTVNNNGQPMRYARDIMRQICEQYKAGAAVGLPSERDPKTGNYIWDLTLPTGMLSGLGAFIDACKYLQDQITSGIGVPPELLQAEASGSGYSGRRIPMEAFLANQQQIADRFLQIFVTQILRPLVRWNFGDVRFNVQVKSLIKTRTKEQVAVAPASPAPQLDPAQHFIYGQNQGDGRQAATNYGGQPENRREVQQQFSHGRDDENEQRRASLERLRGAVKKVGRAA